jgi:tRNA-2-methylthio-N6-dimethylallyladenosine synthase
MSKLSVHIETFGCQMNVSDSERVAAKLRADGFELTETSDSADVILLNTCSIREKAEQKVFRRVNEIKRARVGGQPVVGVLGCVAQLEGEAIFKNSPSVQLVAGTGATDRISNLLERVSGGESRVIDLG